MFDNGIPKHILEGGLGGRRTAGRLRNRWEGKRKKSGTKLFNMKKWHAVARRSSDNGKKTRENGHKKG